MIRSGISQRDLNNQGGLLIVSGSFAADSVSMAVLSSLCAAFRSRLASTVARSILLISSSWVDHDKVMDDSN